MPRYQKSASAGLARPQNPYPLPVYLLLQALVYERRNGGHRHFQAAGCLGARPVTVEAFQIAAVGHIDLGIFTTGPELPAEARSDKRLGPDKLVKIRGQPLESDVAMTVGGVHAR